MRENHTSGSVQGVPGNRHSYCDILVLALLSPPYLCAPCSCGVLTLCGMGYRTPQMVCSHGTPRLPPLYGALSGVLV